MSVAPMKIPWVTRSPEATGGDMREVRPVDIAEREGHNHPDGRHSQCGRTDAEHLAQVGLEADLEEQQHDAQLGEHMHHIRGGTLGGTTPRTPPPRTTPATSSPSTAGCPSRSASSPKSLAPTSMAAIARNSRAMSGPPSAASRGNTSRIVKGATRDVTTSERLFRLRREMEGVPEERKVDTVAVLGVNGDHLGSPNVERQRTAEQRVGSGGKTAVDDSSLRLGAMRAADSISSWS